MDEKGWHGEMVAHRKKEEDVEAIVRSMHGLVTYGPGDLDIAAAMSVYGFDEVKWAEGQGMLAELLSIDPSPETRLKAAMGWYEEAVGVARHALAASPQLLAKLGVTAAESG